MPISPVRVGVSAVFIKGEKELEWFHAQPTTKGVSIKEVWTKDRPGLLDIDFIKIGHTPFTKEDIGKVFEIKLVMAPDYNGNQEERIYPKMKLIELIRASGTYEVDTESFHFEELMHV